VSGGTDDQNEPEGEDGDQAGAWPRSEFDTLGPLSERELDAQWAALDGLAPWQPVRPAEVAPLMGAYREAGLMAVYLRGLLLGSGLKEADVPEARPDVDGKGRPVVTLVKLSADAVEHLARLLRGWPGQPNPPATEHKRRAA
jgi:hypothetical protein